MKNEKNAKHTAPNADDFIGGNYLRKEDIREPQNVTVSNVWSEKVLGSNRPRLIVAFEELDKPLILNKTNTKRLMTIFGTPETTEWRGQILLYVEKGVEYAGRVVGGLRVNRPKAINGQLLKNRNAASSSFSVDEMDDGIL